MSHFLQDAGYEARDRYTTAASAAAFHAGAAWAFDRMRAELAQAREVLMKAEWQPRQSWAETIYICPSCWADRRDGHVPDCKLNAALAAKGE